jgi:hypothetical protein
MAEPKGTQASGGGQGSAPKPKGGKKGGGKGGKGK